MASSCQWKKSHHVPVKTRVLAKRKVTPSNDFRVTKLLYDTACGTEIKGRKLQWFDFYCKLGIYIFFQVLYLYTNNEDDHDWQFREGGLFTKQCFLKNGRNCVK